MAMPDDLTTLICLFHTEAQADGALNDLQHAGVPLSNITVLGRKSPESQGYADTPLSGLGVPQKDIDHLQEGLRNGGVLIAVTAVGGDQKAVDDIFKNHKASKIDDQRTDDYTNYKKYKPETQEHPDEFASSSAAATSSTAVPFSSGSFGEQLPAAPPATGTAELDEAVLVEDGVIVDSETGAAIPARVVHIYRRDPDAF